MAVPDNYHRALDLLIRGFQISRVIRLAADLGIADRVEPEATSTVQDLATVCCVLPEPLRRALRLLAAFEIFHVGKDDTIAHTPRSLLLRTDTPNSLHHAARFWTGTGSWRAWEELDAALDGRVPHEVAWNTSRFEYLRKKPDEARLFDAFMANFPDNRHAAVATAYDFSKARLIADIGGGNGEALRRIPAIHPGVRGIVFDRADVVAAIPAEALENGRIATQGGSFFAAVPSDADLYMLIRVLHDWSDEDASRILQSCRAGMRNDAKLLVIEGLIDPDPRQGLPTEYLIDMQMMAMFGQARERTETEFRGLLARAKFRLERVIPTGSPVFILEAAPI